MYKSSVSSGEVRYRDSNIFEASRREVLEAGNRRFNINTLEFANKIKHSATQTDSSISTIDLSEGTTDEYVQIDLTSGSLDALQNEIREIYGRFEKEKARMSERERLLIAQMNALRDQQCRDANEQTLNLLMEVSDCRIDCSLIPPDFDGLDIEVMTTHSQEGVSRVSFVKASGGGINASGLTSRIGPFSLYVPISCGSISLQFRFFSIPANTASFTMVLGEWTSPPFVPCLKERGKMEKVRAILNRLGTVDIELTVIYMIFEVAKTVLDRI